MENTENKDNGGKPVMTDSQKATPDSIHKQVSEMYAKLGLSDQPHVYAPEGITFDFCWGLRIHIPETPVRPKYRVKYWDMDDEHLVYNEVVGAASWIQSLTHYYKRYSIEISDATTGDTVFVHEFNLKGKPVLISFPVDTVGDTLAWFKAVEEFGKIHQCRLLVSVADHMRALLEPCHPDIKFVDRKSIRSIRPYAFYVMGVNFNGDDSQMLPYDWRYSPLDWVGASILGLDPFELQSQPPKIAYDTEKREIKEPYVCIAAMASGGCKLWMNPGGWEKVIDFLKGNGYRVIDIDGKKITGEGLIYQRLPANAEDFSGMGYGKELADRANLIHHADFFIGVGSGLSWLSWAVGKPTVLISGFSLPYCEFHTPYRIINNYVCHGCFNDPKFSFDGHDTFWCPKHKGTSQHLICSLAITPAQVINAIKRIPEFQTHMEKRLRQAQTAELNTADVQDNLVDSVKTGNPESKNGPIVLRVENGQVIDQIKTESISFSPDMVIRPGDSDAPKVFAQIRDSLNKETEQ